MATYSRILAWEIPQTEDPGWLWSMGSQRVRHSWTQHNTTNKCLKGWLPEEGGWLCGRGSTAPQTWLFWPTPSLLKPQFPSACMWREDECLQISKLLCVRTPSQCLLSWSCRRWLQEKGRNMFPAVTMVCIQLVSLILFGNWISILIGKKCWFPSGTLLLSFSKGKIFI